MERSDDYIDFKAYIRYLKKVTGEPADPEALKSKILSKTTETTETTEMQTAYMILKRLTVVAAVVLILAFCSVLYGYFSKGEVLDKTMIWTDARVYENGRTPASRLYEAYRNSSEIREKFL